LSAVLPEFEFIKRYYWGLIIISDIYPFGKAGLAFKNFVTDGPDSITAAVAAQCAKEQGKLELLLRNYITTREERILVRVVKTIWKDLCHKYLD
jgi:hypothetical protein